MKENSGRIEKI